MYLRKSKKYNDDDSIDRVLFYDENGYEFRLEHTLYDESSDFILEYERKDTIAKVRNLVEELPDKPRKVIKLYFGFYNDEEYTQEAIAEILGISQSYTSKIINDNVKKLQIELRRQKLI